MISCLHVLALATATSMVLWAFYKSFEVEWPDRYYDGLNGADPLVSRTSGRYAAFRLLPFFVALVVFGAAAGRTGVNRTAVLWVTSVMYVGGGPGRLAVLAWLEKPRRIGSAFHRVATALGLSMVAALYGAVGARLDEYVPSLKDVVFAAFIAVFVFLMGKLGIVALTIQSPSDETLVERALSEIDPSLRARLNEADPGGVFLTVAVVEQLNRPRWVRRLERLVPGAETHGLMQMKADSHISDGDSVEQFIDRHSKVCGRDYWDRADSRAFFKRHNPGKEFNELAGRLHTTVWVRY